MDRSAAYAARYDRQEHRGRRSCVKRCQVQLAYAIGVAHPVSVLVETFGTGTVADDEASKRPSRRSLTCARPPSSATSTCAARSTSQLAAYGHMGREELGVAWEKCDRVEALRAAL